MEKERGWCESGGGGVGGGGGGALLLPPLPLLCLLPALGGVNPAGKYPPSQWP